MITKSVDLYYEVYRESNSAYQNLYGEGHMNRQIDVLKKSVRESPLTQKCFRSLESSDKKWFCRVKFETNEADVPFNLMLFKHFSLVSKQQKFREIIYASGLPSSIYTNKYAEEDVLSILKIYNKGLEESHPDFVVRMIKQYLRVPRQVISFD